MPLPQCRPSISHINRILPAASGNRAMARIRFPHGGRAETQCVDEMLGRSSSLRETKKGKQRKAEPMRILILVAFAISGLALVTGQRCSAQNPTTVLVPRTEGLSFGFPSGYSGVPTYLNYYPYGYYRHPYVHYYPYAGNPYSYYSAPPRSMRYSAHRTYRHNRYHRHHSD